VFCCEDGTLLDRWQVRREFGMITKAAGLGEDWTPRELRHWFVSILSASGTRIEDISDPPLAEDPCPRLLDQLAVVGREGLGRFALLTIGQGASGRSATFDLGPRDARRPSLNSDQPSDLRRDGGI
jgi:hypothetical protein